LSLGHLLLPLFLLLLLLLCAGLWLRLLRLLLSRWLGLLWRPSLYSLNRESHRHQKGKSQPAADPLHRRIPPSGESLSVQV
jgi:hypothetical protein